MPGQESVIHGRVVGVTDGDTIKVLVAEKQLLRIRLAFCDAPEKKQAFGARAKQAMSDLAFGKDIELRPHAIDRYGRTVAQVGVDGKDVGEQMLRQGMAWVYDRYITEATTEIQNAYRKSQEDAKADKRGLWSDPSSIPPWIFRDLAKAHQEQTIASNCFRHGTLSLYAALDTRTGDVIGKTTDRHTSVEFVDFLSAIVASQPAGREIHIVADNLSAHKTKGVFEFLNTNPAVRLHYTPTYSSWLNQVEI